MIFSPITERSLRVRMLYIATYALLSAGALTMVIPFIIMLSGSVEPSSRGRDSMMFPLYLLDDRALWTRYLQAKYKNKTDLFRMAWGNAEADLLNPSAVRADGVIHWKEFLDASEPPELLWGVGFCDVSSVSPYYNNRVFQDYLRKRYSTIGQLNQALASTFKAFHNVVPPNIGLSGSVVEITPFIGSFIEFSASEVPLSQKFAWDAGGFYRSVFLPRVVGRNISDFNRRYGTSYESYTEVPFSASVPEVAADVWMTFVSKLLRPEFVDLTPLGQDRFEKSGQKIGEFIRLASKPEDLQVMTLDRRFAAWMEEQYGVRDARIPQAQLDLLAFNAEKSFWKRVFFTQNYRFVLDTLLLHGNAFRNTAILVILMVGGTLLVNPLAAYALSRFKMRQTYSILLFFMATVAFPAEVTMIPVFLQLKEFNLLNTFGALVLPGLANGFSIFLLKGFFDSIPREMYEAAEIDGAGEWTMFWLVTMNLSKPILAVKALSAFVGAYGAFFYALILAPDPRMWTIMVYVYQLQQSAGTPVVYASLILTAVPMLLVFIFCQNIILRGIVVPSEK